MKPLRCIIRPDMPWCHRWRHVGSVRKPDVFRHRFAQPDARRRNKHRSRAGTGLRRVGFIWLRTNYAKHVTPGLANQLGRGLRRQEHRPRPGASKHLRSALAAGCLDDDPGTTAAVAGAQRAARLSDGLLPAETALCDQKSTPCCVAGRMDGTNGNCHTLQQQTSPLETSI